MKSTFLGLCVALALGGCTAIAPPDTATRAAAPEVVLIRGPDPRGADKVYTIEFGGQTTTLAPGQTLRQSVPVGRYTLRATTEPPRIDLRDILDIAPFDKTQMALTMYPGRTAVIRVETGPFGGPRFTRMSAPPR